MAPITMRKQSNAYTTQNKIKLISGGKEYFELLLQLIHQSTDTIHLQTYILNDDDTGCKVIDALKEAAARKVEVYLLADGYASQRLSKKMIGELQEAKIHFRFFQPLFKSKHFYFGRRLHQKLFIADGKHALVGGLNIADRYNDMPDTPAWLDFALYAEGEIVKELCILCWKTWNDFLPGMSITPCEEKPAVYNLNNEPASKVRMRRNDWVRHKNEISATYIEMLRTARSHITIVCSYFLPGKFIRRLLKNAVNRGVKIKVITAGRSDITISKYAERWMYDWLLRHKIDVYEYQPSILHAKLATCDDEWMTIGSYNINDISAYASIELNLDVKDYNFVSAIENRLDHLIQHDCILISKEVHLRSKNILKQFVRWFSYGVIHTLFHLVTFYYKRRVS